MGKEKCIAFFSCFDLRFRKHSNMKCLVPAKFLILRPRKQSFLRHRKSFKIRRILGASKTYGFRMLRFPKAYGFLQHVKNFIFHGWKSEIFKHQNRRFWKIFGASKSMISGFRKHNLQTQRVCAFKGQRSLMPRTFHVRRLRNSTNFESFLDAKNS